MSYTKKALFTLIFAALSLGALAQTSSPYSRYGLGSFQQKGSVRTRMMGGAAVGVQNRLDVNNVNPSALVAMDSTAVLFDIAFHAVKSSFSSGDETQSVYSGNLDYVALMIPMHRRWFLSATIQPLTSVGYNINAAESYSKLAPGDDGYAAYGVNFNGKGGVSLATVTNSFKLPWGFSVGAELGVLWGNHNETITESYVGMDITYTVRNEIEYHRGVWATTGAQFKHDFSKVGFILGGTFDIPTTISSYSESSTVSPKGDIQENVTGTVVNKLPLGYGAGFSIVYDHKLTIAGDYKMKQWGDSSFGATSSKLTNNHIFSFGGELTPNFNSNKYLNRVSYRGGVHYETGSFSVSSISVESSYVSLGLGLPGRTSSTLINVGFEFGEIGRFNSSGITETYGKINVGLNLGEIWFVKPKFF